MESYCETSSPFVFLVCSILLFILNMKVLSAS